MEVMDQRIDDLEEKALWISGIDDDAFNQNDAIFFYGEGAEKWEEGEDDQFLTYNDNPFEIDNYAYLRLGVENGKRIIESGENVDDVIAVDYYLETQRYEQNKYNLLEQNFGTIGTGQEWYGEYFDNDKRQEFSDKFSVDNVEPNSTAKLKVRFIGRSSSSSTLRAEIFDETFNKTFSSVSLSSYTGDYARIRLIDEEFTISDNNFLSLIHI